MFDLKSIKAMNDRFAEHKAREALRRGSKKSVCRACRVKEAKPNTEVPAPIKVPENPALGGWM